MRDHVPPRLLLRWWPASTRRSSSPWCTRRSTWRTTCWPGNTSALGSADCPPSRCPTCRRTAWRSGPASWTCGQCPPPLVTEWESPLLGGFITASYSRHCFHLHSCLPLYLSCHLHHHYYHLVSVTLNIFLTSPHDFLFDV